MIQYLQTAFLLILLTLTTGKKTYSQEMQPISAADIPQIQPSKKEKKSTQLFNKDGNPDIIWRNKVNGINVIWFMNANGSNYTSFVNSPTVSDLNWDIVGPH